MRGRAKRTSSDPNTETVSPAHHFMKSRCLHSETCFGRCDEVGPCCGCGSLDGGWSAAAMALPRDRGRRISDRMSVIEGCQSVMLHERLGKVNHFGGLIDFSLPLASVEA